MKKPSSNIAIAEMLRGCEPGRMQTVGLMQVIPLISELEDHRIAPPTALRVRTLDYGTMAFRNEADVTALVPCHAAYLVKEAAQDHAMAHAAFVLAGKTAKFNTAMCIQQTQGGYISEDEHRFSILPHRLHEPALDMRREKSFNKLWTKISEMNDETGGEKIGNLVEFMARFCKELDQFVAEFERVPGQVGAIVLIGGEVVGFERAPSQAYFAAVWEPLIRECYGSEALRRAQLGIAEPQRLPLPKARNLEGLATALEKARQFEEEDVRGKIRSLCSDPLLLQEEGSHDDFRLLTALNQQFAGQIVRENERVHYASLSVRRSWESDSGWRKAKAFAI